MTTAISWSCSTSNPPTDGFELYTIFRKQGIVIYSQQKDSIFIGPFGVLEMGYCH